MPTNNLAVARTARVGREHVKRRKLLALLRCPLGNEIVLLVTRSVQERMSEGAKGSETFPTLTGKTSDKIDAIRRAMEPVERAAASKRRNSTLKQGDQKPAVESFHNGSKTRDKIGAFAGVSRTFYFTVAARVLVVDKRGSRC